MISYNGWLSLIGTAAGVVGAVAAVAQLGQRSPHRADTEEPSQELKDHTGKTRTRLKDEELWPGPLLGISVAIAVIFLIIWLIIKLVHVKAGTWLAWLLVSPPLGIAGLLTLIGFIGMLAVLMISASESMYRAGLSYAAMLLAIVVVNSITVLLAISVGGGLRIIPR